MEKLHKIGKITIETSLIQRKQTSEMFGKLQFVPLHVEHLYHRDCFEMIGLSPLFDSIPFGYTVPVYNIMMSEKENPADGDRIL
jgi:hypothetical protein